MEKPHWTLQKENIKRLLLRCSPQALLLISFSPLYCVFFKVTPSEILCCDILRGLTVSYGRWSLLACHAADFTTVVLCLNKCTVWIFLLLHNRHVHGLAQIIYLDTLFYILDVVSHLQIESITYKRQSNKENGCSLWSFSYVNRQIDPTSLQP